MAVLAKRQAADAAAPGSPGAAPAAGKRLKPVFVYHDSFDTQALGERLVALTALRPWISLAEIALNWAIVVGVIAAAEAARPYGWGAYLPAWALAVAVVGARMHALLVLMHDASHNRVLPHKAWNDRLANWLCAFPAGVSVEAYRKEHLAHHFYVNSEKDPNWISKKDDPDWVFPTTRGALAWLFTKELLGHGFLRIFRYIRNYGRHSKRDAEKKPGGKAKLVERFAYYALLAGTLTAVSGWRVFLAYWVVALVTVLPAVLRMRILSEHHGIERKDDLSHSRNYHASLLERFFLAPHNVHYHLVHHLFPAIPFYNVPEAHELLRELPEYRDGARESDTVLMPGRLSVVYDLTRPATEAALAG